MTNNENRLAEDVKCWTLFAYDPLPTWVYGKIVLVGDAAHPVSQHLVSCYAICDSQTGIKSLL